MGNCFEPHRSTKKTNVRIVHEKRKARKKPSKTEEEEESVREKPHSVAPLAHLSMAPEGEKSTSVSTTGTGLNQTSIPDSSAVPDKSSSSTKKSPLVPQIKPGFSTSMGTVPIYLGKPAGTTGEGEKSETSRTTRQVRELKEHIEKNTQQIQNLDKHVSTIERQTRALSQQVGKSPVTELHKPTTPTKVPPSVNLPARPKSNSGLIRGSSKNGPKSDISTSIAGSNIVSDIFSIGSDEGESEQTSKKKKKIATREHSASDSYYIEHSTPSEKSEDNKTGTKVYLSQLDKAPAPKSGLVVVKPTLAAASSEPKDDNQAKGGSALPVPLPKPPGLPEPPNKTETTEIKPTGLPAPPQKLDMKSTGLPVPLSKQSTLPASNMSQNSDIVDEPKSTGLPVPLSKPSTGLPAPPPKSDIGEGAKSTGLPVPLSKPSIGLPAPPPKSDLGEGAKSTGLPVPLSKPSTGLPAPPPKSDLGEGAKATGLPVPLSKPSTGLPAPSNKSEITEAKSSGLPAPLSKADQVESAKPTGLSEPVKGGGFSLPVPPKSSLPAPSAGLPIPVKKFDLPASIKIPTTGLPIPHKKDESNMPMHGAPEDAFKTNRESAENLKPKELKTDNSFDPNNKTARESDPKLPNALQHPEKSGEKPSAPRALPLPAFKKFNKPSTLRLNKSKKQNEPLSIKSTEKSMSQTQRSGSSRSERLDKDKRISVLAIPRSASFKPAQ